MKGIPRIRGLARTKFKAGVDGLARAQTTEPRKPAPRSQYEVSFTRTVTMHYHTEIWARDEADALTLAEEESLWHAWVEGDVIDESKPRVRKLS